jgi:hypothetical protein
MEKYMQFITPSVIHTFQENDMTKFNESKMEEIYLDGRKHAVYAIENAIEQGSAPASIETAEDLVESEFEGMNTSEIQIFMRGFISVMLETISLHMNID